MKIGDTRHRDATYRFVVSTPTAHGWQDFVALMKDTQQATTRDACHEVAQALHRSELCPSRTQHDVSENHENGVGEGTHLILGSTELLSKAAQETWTPSTVTPTRTSSIPLRPQALKFTTLPEPPERNAVVHIASALVPVLAAVGFAVFAKSYWFLMLALTSPIMVAITTRAQASMHGRRLRAVQSQNFAAFHLQRASHTRYMEDLAAHLEAEHGCVADVLRGTSTPTVAQPGGDLFIRLGVAAVTRGIEFDHDIAREVASMRTRVVTGSRGAALDLPDDPRLHPHDVSAFASHLTGADIGPLHVQSTHTMPTLVRFPAPPAAQDAAFGRAPTAAAHVGLRITITSDLQEGRSFAAWILVQCFHQLRTYPVAVQMEGHTASWLLRALMWIPTHSPGHEWHIKVSETRTELAGDKAAVIDIAILGPGAADVSASLRVALQTASATEPRTGSVSWVRPPSPTPSSQSRHSTSEDPRSMAEISRDSTFCWEGLTPVEWDDWMRAHARRHISTGHSTLRPVPFSTLHSPSAASSTSTEAPIGAGVLGAVLHDDAIAPLEFNLIDDGPHMFVAGTTGSGKSEFLRSLVASFCFHASPRFTQLVLLDFKGGAGFDELSTLDHVAEVVTNLDEHAAMRTLESLSAEMRRRQLLFRDAGVSSWPEFFEQEVMRKGIDTHDAPFAAPRLIIVVDEFRVLLDDFPESRTAFTRIAALGRSLGVHLVLATQRPGGSLSPDLAANIGLRVCLRVNDRLESIETLGSPVAASISRNHPGRAYVTRESSAQSEEPLVFQSSMLGDESLDVSGVSGASRIQIGRYGHDLPSQAGPRNADHQATLQWIARHCSEAGILPVSPILPPLPRVLSTLHLDRLATAEAAVGLPLGALDDPAHLQYRTLLWQPSAGHTVIVGAAGTGKTHTLHLLLSLAARAISEGNASDETNEAPANRGERADPGTLASITRIQVLSAAGPHDVPEYYESAAVTHINHRDLTGLTAWLDALEEDSTAVGTGRTLVCIDDVDRLMTELTPTNYQSTDAGTRSVLLARVQQFVSAPHAHCTLVLTGSRKVLASPAMNASDQFILLRPSESQDYSLLGVPSHKTAALNAPGRCFVKAAGIDLLEGQILANRDAAINWLQRTPIR